MNFPRAMHNGQSHARKSCRTNDVLIAAYTMCIENRAVVESAFARVSSCEACIVASVSLFHAYIPHKILAPVFGLSHRDGFLGERSIGELPIVPINVPFEREV